jgi:hypothetical protein
MYQAERFLRRLDKALIALPASRRESVVAEYRQRLTSHAAYGFGSLRAALNELGSAEEVAKTHLAEGAVAETFEISSCRALVPMPEHRNLPVLSTFVPWRTVRGDLQATFAASREELIPVGGAVFACATGVAILSTHAGLSGDRALGAAVDGLLLPVLLSICLAAALRAMLTREGPVWTIDRGLATLAGIGAGLGVAAVATSAAISAVTEASSLDGWTSAGLVPAVIGALTVAMAWIAVPSLPWVVGLVTDQRAFSHSQGRARMLRRRRAWAAAVAATLMPLLILHVLLRAAPLFFPIFGGPHIALAGLDGIVVAGMVLSGSAFLSVAFRWTAGETIPDPVPFTLRKASSDEVQVARRRMERLAEMESTVVKPVRFGGAPPLAGGG